MSAHEPPLWAYPVIAVVLLICFFITLFFMVISLMLCVFALGLIATLIIRIAGHMAFTVTSLFCGIEHPFCGQIIEWEMEELAYRKERREKALQRRDTTRKNDETKPCTEVLVE